MLPIPTTSSRWCGDGHRAVHGPMAHGRARCSPPPHSADAWTQLHAPSNDPATSAQQLDEARRLPAPLRRSVRFPTHSEGGSRPCRHCLLDDDVCSRRVSGGETTSSVQADAAAGRRGSDPCVCRDGQDAVGHPRRAPPRPPRTRCVPLVCGAFQLQQLQDAAVALTRHLLERFERRQAARRRSRTPSTTILYDRDVILTDDARAAVDTLTRVYARKLQLAGIGDGTACFAKPPLIEPAAPAAARVRSLLPGCRQRQARPRRTAEHRDAHEFPRSHAPHPLRGGLLVPAPQSLRLSEQAAALWGTGIPATMPCS